MAIVSGKTQQQYDEIIGLCRELMLKKNSDYGDSWRSMRVSSITDQILVKTQRIIQLEELDKKGLTSEVSEGIESEFRDILNYACFALIKLSEK